jgi:hypothetical protein
MVCTEVPNQLKFVSRPHPTGSRTDFIYTDFGFKPVFSVVPNYIKNLPAQMPHVVFIGSHNSIFFFKDTTSDCVSSNLAQAKCPAWIPPVLLLNLSEPVRSCWKSVSKSWQGLWILCQGSWWPSCHHLQVSWIVILDEVVAMLQIRISIDPKT